MIEYKNAKEIFKEKGFEWVKGWVAELDKRNIKERTERELEAARLIESWELVEKHGGLIEAKYYLHAIAVSGSDFFDALYSAVEDVESCQ